MARGWESKSVEAQIEGSSERPASRNTPFSGEERQKQTRVNNLMLSRTRVLTEMQHCCNVRFRVQLESELVFLEMELKKYAN
ncbi:MAG: hypothetical protein HY858_00165 [Candidatus Solibacter usitatus]|nr:hypothetical protein [Candidatus Solibacter usitatus]